MCMIKFSYLLLVILLWLQYSLWLGKNGILDFIRIYNMYSLSKNIYDLNQLKIRNGQLLLDICDLLYKDEIIEEYARYDLGLIKPDEVYYQIQYDF